MKPEVNMTQQQNTASLEQPRFEVSQKKQISWRSRRIWEPVTTIMILGGIVMLMQPFFMVLFTYSFIVILIGTIGFAVATKQAD